MRVLVAFAVPFLLIAAAVLFAPSHGVQQDADRPAATTSIPSNEPAMVAAPTAAAPAPAKVPAAAKAPVQLPGSLEGTEADGAWPVDAAHHLRINAELLRRLEYHFSARGEEPESATLARIRAELSALPEPARDEAEAFLQRYLRYREQGRTLAGRALPSDEARLDAVVKLRREIFGADAEALFGDDERAARLGLEERKIRQDPSLDPASREAKLKELDAQRTAAAQAAGTETNTVGERVKAERELRREGATDEDLHQYRLQTVGPEATTRLEALDQERAAWQARVQAYEAERARISQEAADRLLEQRFTEPERLRVRAWERMHAAH